jgi:hypothetical protein
MTSVTMAAEAVGTNWMREDEWEIGQMSFALINEAVANTLDRLRVRIQPPLSEADQH